MRIAIVFNPGSGPRAARGALSAVVAGLASHNHELEVIDSQTQPDFERALRNDATSLDRAIAIGGDGTLNGVVNAVASSANPSLPVAFVPTGRGKDAARSLPSWSASELSKGRFELAEVSAIDLMHVSLVDGTTRFGVNISDIGLAARAAVIANGLPRWLRSLSYVAGAARAIVPPKSFRLKITVDGEQHSFHDALLLSVCNGKTFGGGIHISPQSSCADGLLDVVVVHNANLIDLGLQLGKLKKGTLLDHQALLRFQGTSITVEPVSSPWFEVDGEQLSSQPVSYEIAPMALNWITP